MKRQLVLRTGSTMVSLIYLLAVVTPAQLEFEDPPTDWDKIAILGGSTGTSFGKALPLDLDHDGLRDVAVLHGQDLYFLRSPGRVRRAELVESPVWDFAVFPREDGEPDGLFTWGPGGVKLWSWDAIAGPTSETLFFELGGTGERFLAVGRLGGPSWCVLALLNADTASFRSYAIHFGSGGAPTTQNHMSTSTLGVTAEALTMVDLDGDLSSEVVTPTSAGLHFFSILGSPIELRAHANSGTGGLTKRPVASGEGLVWAYRTTSGGWDVLLLDVLHPDGSVILGDSQGAVFHPVVETVGEDEQWLSLGRTDGGAAFRELASDPLSPWQVWPGSAPVSVEAAAIVLEANLESCPVAPELLTFDHTAGLAIVHRGGSEELGESESWLTATLYPDEEDMLLSIGVLTAGLSEATHAYGEAFAWYASPGITMHPPVETFSIPIDEEPATYPIESGFDLLIVNVVLFDAENPIEALTYAIEPDGTYYRCEDLHPPVELACHEGCPPPVATAPGGIRRLPGPPPPPPG